MKNWLEYASNSLGRERALSFQVELIAYLIPSNLQGYCEQLRPTLLILLPLYKPYSILSHQMSTNLMSIEKIWCGPRSSNTYKCGVWVWPLGQAPVVVSYTTGCQTSFHFTCLISTYILYFLPWTIPQHWSCPYSELLYSRHPLFQRYSSYPRACASGKAISFVCLCLFVCLSPQKSPDLEI